MLRLFALLHRNIGVVSSVEDSNRDETQSNISDGREEQIAPGEEQFEDNDGRSLRQRKNEKMMKFDQRQMPCTIYHYGTAMMCNPTTRSAPVISLNPSP